MVQENWTEAELLSGKTQEHHPSSHCQKWHNVNTIINNPYFSEGCVITVHAGCRLERWIMTTWAHWTFWTRARFWDFSYKACSGLRVLFLPCGSFTVINSLQKIKTSHFKDWISVQLDVQLRLVGWDEANPSSEAANNYISSAVLWNFPEWRENFPAPSLQFSVLLLILNSLQFSLQSWLWALNSL